ncbi:hypothetical protein HHK36_013161 [Tetracentron sinense]|uniref:Glycosyltransferase N-terminal domain-containing protein n=1 Tax=Tetracentron sinense TaxID=13715 RepID=A0A834Z789_TETSI|nr:hypothetical protein HHK36_013161 [Tetracentron sinense]
MNTGEHIVMLPFMAQGHIIPFLALARKIQQHTGYTITIVNTPLNVRYLQSTISSDTPTNTNTNTIRVAELPFCSSDHGLPPNSENTDSMPPHQFIKLMTASQTLQPSFHRLVSTMVEQESRPPLCIISDVFLGWAVDVAKSVGTSHVSFTTGGNFGTAAYFSLWLNLPHRSTDSDEFTLPGFPDSRRFHRSQLHPFLRAADGTDPWSRFFQKQIPLSLGSNAMLCNTVEEIEPLGLELLRKNTSLPVWAIGPLLPPSFLRSSSGSNISYSRVGKEPSIAPERCIQWLDFHPLASVLYISFGCQNTISASQMMELAMGVEASGKPFYLGHKASIWV